MNLAQLGAEDQRLKEPCRAGVKGQINHFLSRRTMTNQGWSQKRVAENPPVSIQFKKHKMHKIQINYKSGRTIIARFQKFSVTSNGAEITKIEWEIDNSGNMKPLFIGIDEIESIFQLPRFSFLGLKFC